MTPEPLFAAIAEAVFSALLQESGLAERTRAALGRDPTRRAFQTALAQTYAAFARQYPEWTAALFDETFLNSRDVVPLLAELLTRCGQPDPARLARLFAAHLGHPDPDRWERLGDATRAAADFLTWLEAELARQEALQPLSDSRALERIANTPGPFAGRWKRLPTIGKRQPTSLSYVRPCAMVRSRWRPASGPWRWVAAPTVRSSLPAMATSFRC